MLRHFFVETSRQIDDDDDDEKKMRFIYAVRRSADGKQICNSTAENVSEFS